MATKGVDPMELPFDRFLNLAYHVATMNSEERDRNSFDIKLNMPPTGTPRTAEDIPASSPWSKENETLALGGLAAALRGG